MRPILVCLGLIAALALVIAGNAQEEAKQPKESTKKTKSKTKKTPPKVEKLSYSQIVAGKLQQYSNRDLTVAISVIDPQKYLAFKQWQAQKNLEIQRANANNRLRLILQFRQQLAKKQMEIYTSKDIALRFSNKPKIRTMFPPFRYDDKGNVVRWTKKELRKLRGDSRLPGYPSEVDALRKGQQIQAYIEKVPRKKAPSLLPTDDPNDHRPKVILLVVTQDAPLK